VFTEPLLINGLHNPVVLLLLAYMLQTFPSNGRCLQSYRLATGLYATIYNVYQENEHLKREMFIFELLRNAYPTELQETRNLKEYEEGGFSVRSLRMTPAMVTSVKFNRCFEAGPLYMHAKAQSWPSMEVHE
jgi:hypothetical protein